MDIEKLEHTARMLVVPGKGLLAADETNACISEQFEHFGVRSDEDSRRVFRELLITARPAEQYISGVTLREEALFQATDHGQLFREYAKNHQMLPGVTVDKGSIDLPGFPNEKVAQGIDSLPLRLHTFAAAGAMYAKWRFCIVITDGEYSTPTDEAIGANTLSAARFARVCQDAGLVPIVEVRIRPESTHSLDRAESVLAHTLDILFATLRAFRVHIPATILSSTFVTAGDENSQANLDEIADRTCRVLHDHIPHEVAGIVLSDWGLDAQDACTALDKIVQRGPHPWGMTFMFQNALSDTALAAWASGEGHQAEHQAQQLYGVRAAQAAAASKGVFESTNFDHDQLINTGVMDEPLSEEEEMKLRLEQMQANCAKARAAMERARREGFAFGAFNLDDEATLRAVVRAAKAKNAPVLVEVSQGEVDDIGIQTVRDMVDNFKAEYGVEIYINLDHSPSVEAAKKGIDAGYEFIHIDVSQANHDASDAEIIAATREVVEYAKKTGALVESEPHYFGGSSNLHTEAIDYDEIKKTFSTPEGAKTFVDATGIDTFAAAIGNLHGKYPVPKELDLELLQRLRDVLPGNISLHGGSGTPGDQFERAVAIGVTKININSDMRIAYREALEKTLTDNPKESSVSKLVGKDVVPAVQAVVESKIDMFNSAGKARP